MTFTVVRALGRGAGGEVFLVEDEAHRLRALKRPLPDVPEALQALERERRTLAALAHPNIVALLGAGADAQGPYLVLEYVDGHSLAVLHDAAAALNRPVPAEAVCALAVSLASALTAAHSASVDGAPGVVHRDLSAENVLIGRDGVVKLADFGVARTVGGAAVASAGVLKGRLSSFAPELLDGAPPSPASDVFALGALLFRLIAGVDPFVGNSDAEVLRALRHGRAPSLASFHTDVPAPLVAWVDAALSSEPSARPALSQVLALGAREVMSAGQRQWRSLIDVAGATVGASSGPWTASVVTTTRTPRRWWPVVVVVLAVLGLLAFVQWVSPLGALSAADFDVDGG